MVSQNLAGCTEVALILPGQLLRECVSSQNVEHLWRIQFIGFNPAEYGISVCLTLRSRWEFDPSCSVIVRTSLC